MSSTRNVDGPDPPSGRPASESYLFSARRGTLFSLPTNTKRVCFISIQWQLIKPIWWRMARMMGGEGGGGWRLDKASIEAWRSPIRFPPSLPHPHPHPQPRLQRGPQYPKTHCLKIGCPCWFLCRPELLRAGIRHAYVHMSRAEKHDQ